MQGKITIFGGPEDTVCLKSNGLTLYDHQEADLRPDLFHQAGKDQSMGTSKRLTEHALYFSYRYPLKSNRKCNQEIPWRLKNPKNGKRIMASLINWGPIEKSDKMFSLSPMAAKLLEVKTDDVIEAMVLA